MYELLRYMFSCEDRTSSLTLRLNIARSLRHMTAASRLAGDSSLGSDSIDITEIMIDSTPKMGRQRSSAVSYRDRKVNSAMNHNISS